MNHPHCTVLYTVLCTVLYRQVSIINVNDNEPEFLIQDKTIRGIMENTVPVNPIITIRARDPDYDPTVMTEPEKIKFSISTGLYSDNFNINQKGELFLIRPLDRDAPLGHKEWTVTVLAEDSLNGKELDNTLELSIMLEDENDNAPFLDMVTSTLHPVRLVLAILHEITSS